MVGFEVFARRLLAPYSSSIAAFAFTIVRLVTFSPQFTSAWTISSINDIHGFRLNLFDSEQTMTISDFNIAVVVPTLDGDFNGDGYVDAKDLNDPTLGWKARFGVDLDGEDFLTWQRNFGAGTPPAAWWDCRPRSTTAPWW